MCAVGWLVVAVFGPQNVKDKANAFLLVLSRGFDVQVNGAMIAVPAFRRDFG